MNGSGIDWTQVLPLLISGVTLVILAGQAFVHRTNANTVNTAKQGELVIQLASKTGDALVASEQAKGAASLALVRIDYLERDNTRLEASNLKLEKRVIDNDALFKVQTDDLRAQIVELQTQVRELKDLLRAKQSELDSIKSGPPPSTASPGSAIAGTVVTGIVEGVVS